MAFGGWRNLKQVLFYKNCSDFESKDNVPNSFIKNNNLIKNLQNVIEILDKASNILNKKNIWITKNVYINTITNKSAYFS